MNTRHLSGVLRSFCALILLVFISFPALADLCSEGDPSLCRIEIELHKALLKRTQTPITRVSIAEPEIADYHLVTPTQILLMGKETGATNLILWHGEETVEMYEVRVFMPGNMIRQMEQTLTDLIPDSQIHIRAGANGLLLSGEVQSQEDMDKVLKIVSGYVRSYTNLITVRGSQQVQLSVRIAEVSRSGMKQMGLGFFTNHNWAVGVLPSGSIASGAISNSTDRTPGAVTPSISTGESSTSFYETSEGYWSRLTTSTTGGESTASSVDNITRSLTNEMNLSSPFASAIQLAVHSVSDDFMAILSLLKGQNLARILASPTLVTMSGQEASFLAGGEFPVPIEGGDSDTTIQYKSYGIMLRFTPMVTGEETITLQVEPEISSVDYSTAVSSGGVAVPGLKTRRGSTTLQLKDGQTFVMAGLLREELYTTTSKVPLLGDVPYLGSLFTSKELGKKESELMIIVTPRLVRALNPEEVPALPGENEMDMVSDWDFFVKNEMEGGPIMKEPPVDGPDMIGGGGFAQ